MEKGFVEGIDSSTGVEGREGQMIKRDSDTFSSRKSSSGLTEIWNSFFVPTDRIVFRPASKSSRESDLLSNQPIRIRVHQRRTWRSVSCSNTNDTLGPDSLPSLPRSTSPRNTLLSSHLSLYRCDCRYLSQSELFDPKDRCRDQIDQSNELFTSDLIGSRCYVFRIIQISDSKESANEDPTQISKDSERRSSIVLRVRRTRGNALDFQRRVGDTPEMFDDIIVLRTEHSISENRKRRNQRRRDLLFVTVHPLGKFSTTEMNFAHR